MLQSLRVKNFALIEDLEMICTSGLNVLTGETGAGKSILIDALNILLGEKAGPSFIRSGSEKAIIEGTFATRPSILTWLLKNEFIELENEQISELTLTREISKTGSRFRINAILANQTSVSALKQVLLHVNAQHDARTLLSSQSQLNILDAMADSKHLADLDKLAAMHALRSEVTTRLANMQISEEERLKRLDFAKFQINELQLANISDQEEDEQLEKKRLQLANVAQLNLAADTAYHALTGQDSDRSSEGTFNSGSIESLQLALSNIEKASKFDSSLVDVSESLNNALSILEETQKQIRIYRDDLDTDPEALQETEARIAQLATIKRKYGPSLAEALSKLTSLLNETEELENVVIKTEQLENELHKLDKDLRKLAKDISNKRQDLAKILVASMKTELADLGMENCKFEIQFEEQQEIMASGMDRIEFMISPNPGQPLLPLAKIASGGELSRIMLALKSIVTSIDDPPTVIFDEIDTGLSGRIVQAVRDKLVSLSKSRQILCITHQPMIAAAADNHLFVEKTQSKEDTKVSIETLHGQQRVKALAAMATGDAEANIALDFAQALISQQSRP